MTCAVLQCCDPSPTPLTINIVLCKLLGLVLEPLEVALDRVGGERSPSFELVRVGRCGHCWGAVVLVWRWLCELMVVVVMLVIVVVVVVVSSALHEFSYIPSLDPTRRHLVASFARSS